MGLKNWLDGIFSGKEIDRLLKEVAKIEELEPMMSAKSDEELKQFSNELKQRVQSGEELDSVLYEAYALVREAAYRVLGMKHYPVQLLGGIVLHQGRIAEMKTGEGKTLVATLPAYLNALSGKGVHVVTVNDYLAKRDRDWMGKVHEFLGLSVGCLTNDVEGEERRIQYNCDITYGTNNEFGFDYLRDNMKLEVSELVQRELNFAIVDEVDSILIDEARTPLIISGSGNKSTALYERANKFAIGLVKDTDFEVDEEHKSIALTEEGFSKAESYFGIEDLSDMVDNNMEINHHINQALRAIFMMKKDVDYVVQDGEILIVDEFTGRIMYGRRYSNGLHQAIEAKERLEIQKESQTLATITLQNYFRLYNKLAGMTGTAKTEEEEFSHIYNMDVVIIPTNKPVIRKDMDDVIMGTTKAKYEKVIEEIVERHKKNQPVLVGTITIEVSELLHEMLNRRGIQAEVLNAKQHQRESEIVAQAGRYGAVTIATNMAGRGTDIILGGNPEFMAIKEMQKLGYPDYVIDKARAPFHYEEEEIEQAKLKYDEIYAGFKAATDEEAIKVREVGGLHIIGTERHESRRIDNQLRGRAGRQGDPGSTQFFISLEDELMKIFLPEGAKSMVENLGLKGDMQIEAKLLSKQIEIAQKRVEGRNFSIRKHVLEYDDVMNRQRQIIYSQRQRVLNGENLREYIISMAEDIITEFINSGASGLMLSNYGNKKSVLVEDTDFTTLNEFLIQMFFESDYKLELKEDIEVDELVEKIKAQAIAKYESIEAQFKELEHGEELIRDVERNILLRVVDLHWIDHIDAMDQLKQGIGLRAIGQKNPVEEYKFEGFDMFDEMIFEISKDTISHLFHIKKPEFVKREAVAEVSSESHGTEAPKPKKRKEAKIGRNELCPCGSGKKYKKCCGLNE